MQGVGDEGDVLRHGPPIPPERHVVLPDGQLESQVSLTGGPSLELPESHLHPRAPLASAIDREEPFYRANRNQALGLVQATDPDVPVDVVVDIW